ncbi:MAG: 3-isopropylmalate dehydratase small subunit, partial [Actinobacteria bacterium]|nr:3-isopropylmalate dehydratase small subunit [Actinomycetota bacterium]
EVRYGSTTVAFELDEYTRWRLMEGLDDIGLTLRNIDSVLQFEKTRADFKPKTLPIA